jgi:hypothetical protein
VLEKLGNLSNVLSGVMLIEVADHREVRAGERHFEGSQIGGAVSTRGF